MNSLYGANINGAKEKGNYYKNSRWAKITVAYLLSLVTMGLLLALYWSSDSITLTGFLIVLAFVVVLLPIFLVKDIFHPFIILSISTLLALINFIDVDINGVTLKYALGFSEDYSDVVIQYSMMIFITWYIFFYLGFSTKNVKKTTTNNKRRLPPINYPVNIAYILFAISIIGLMMIVKTFGGFNLMLNAMIDTTRTYSGLGYFRYIVSLGGIASLLLLYAGKNKMAILFLLLTCIMLSPFGGRTAIFLGTIAPFLLIYNYKIKKVKVIPLISIGLIAFIFVLAWEQMRTYGTINLASIPVNNLITSVAEKTRMAHILPSLVGQLLNGSIDYQWGKPLLNIFYSPIPRSLWEGKPEIIEETVLIGSLLIGSEGYYGLPAGPYGWAFLNFGWLGVIIMAFLTGILVKKFYYSAVLVKDDTKSGFLGLIIYSLLINSLFDVFATSAQIQILWILFILFLIYFIDFVLSSTFSNRVKVKSK